MEREVNHEIIEDNPERRSEFTVAIFGTAGNNEVDQPAIANARSNATEIIEKGFSIAHGGYDCGVMGAANEAAAEACRKLGLDPKKRIFAETLNFDTFKSLEVADDEAEKNRSKTLPKRLGHLIDEASGYVVLGGGQGTVVEMMATLESERMNSKGAKDYSVKPLVIIDKSLKMQDLLTQAARREIKLQSPVTAENVYILSHQENAAENEPTPAEITGKIMELYYLEGLSESLDEEKKADLLKLRQELSKYNLSGWMSAQENFEQGGGI